MHNIKKALLGVLLVLVIIVGVEAAVKYGYQDWDYETVQSKQERRELEGTLDTVYLGTSLAYHAFMPEILDEALETQSFNLGTASQPYIGSYYLLRDTAENNPIERVYLAITLPSLVKNETNTEEYTSAFENMLSFKWKLTYLLDVPKEDFWLTALCYSTKVEDYFVPEEIKENITNKLEKTVADSYEGRGYRGSKKTFEGRDVEKENRYLNRWDGEQGENQLLEEGYEYLEKIVEFCNREEIELTLVMPPYPQDYIDGAGDLDQFHAFMTEKAEEWDVEFYNFVYYREREEVFTNERFMDIHHMNNAGAEVFSRLLAEIEQSENPEAFFTEPGEE